MPGKTIASPNLSSSPTNGRPGFSYQFWPDAGVGQPKAPLLAPGAHWSGPNNHLTVIHSRTITKGVNG